MRCPAFRAPAAVALFATVLLVAAVGAQAPAAAPPRPHLDVGADTNDAHAYFLYGMRMLHDKKPAESVRAFYWASRIDPGSGDVLYDLRAATLLAMSNDDLVSYADRSARKKRSAANLALDSLMYRAYARNPFIYRRLEQLVTERLIEVQMSRIKSVDSRTMLEMAYARAMSAGGWRAYSAGRFAESVAEYAEQLKDEKISRKVHEIIDSGIHAERSRIFYLLGNMDSARTEMTAAIDGMRARDSTHIVVLYESKTMYDQSLGMINERAKNDSAARAAYEAALTEDLSNYAAHSRLARLQLAAGDTTAALGEMNLAVQLAPDDPELHYQYALMLVRALHDANAADQLRIAIAADSSYAAPHLLLASIAEAEQYTDQSIEEYRRFIALAAHADPQYGFATTRLSKLTSAVASATPKQ